MQMKQIKFLLAVFVLALGGQLKAVTLPETSEGDKVNGTSCKQRGQTTPSQRFTPLWTTAS